MEFSELTSTAWKAVIWYAHWAAIAFIYLLTKSYVAVKRGGKDHPATLGEKIATYLACSLIVGFFCLALGDRLGTHEEDGSYDEPGEIVVDFEPTDAQRRAYELRMLLVLLPVSLFGLAEGFKRDRTLTPERRWRDKSESDRAGSSDY